MALWKYYHKLRETMGIPAHETASPKTGTLQVVIVVGYLVGINVLFSLDSVFAEVVIMNLETHFWWMVAAILIASVIMIFGMIPLSAIIAKNKHFGVLMVSILTVIATKLLFDGTGAHFSNGLLIFIIAIILLSDAAQVAIDWAARQRLRSVRT